MPTYPVPGFPPASVTSACSCFDRFCTGAGPATLIVSGVPSPDSCDINGTYPLNFTGSCGWSGIRPSVGGEDFVASVVRSTVSPFEWKVRIFNQPFGGGQILVSCGAHLSGSSILPCTEGEIAFTAGGLVGSGPLFNSGIFGGCGIGSGVTFTIS